jgi:hypothetical protein
MTTALIVVGCLAALVIMGFLILKHHGKVLIMHDFIRYLREEETHAVVRLSQEKCEDWDHPDKKCRKKLRSTIASESVQDATNQGLRSVAVVDQDGRVLLLAHLMEEDNWGFLEFGRRGRTLLDELIREKQDKT